MDVREWNGNKKGSKARDCSRAQFGSVHFNPGFVIAHARIYGAVSGICEFFGVTDV
jgi:hypothetical protein